MGFIKPAFYFLSTHLLMMILCYGANSIFPLIPAQVKIIGTIALCTGVAVLALLYSTLFIPAHVNKLTYCMVVFFFLVTSFDNISLIDFFLRPNDIFVTNYFGVGDPFIVNPWAETMMLMDGSLSPLVHFLLFYRMFNGLSWREAELFILAVMFGFMPTFMIPFLSPEASQFNHQLNISHTCWPFLLLIFITLKLTLEVPRSFDFYSDLDFDVGQGRNETNGQIMENGNDAKLKSPTGTQFKFNFFSSFLFKLLSLVMTVATIGIFIFELVVAHNDQLQKLTGVNFEFGSSFNCLKRINPMLLFQPIPAIPIRFGVIHIWLYVVLVFPAFVLHLVSMLKNPGVMCKFLWDMNFVAAGTLFCGQFYFLFGPFHPKTPEEYKVDPENYAFWLFHLLPVVTCIVNTLAFRNGKTKTAPSSAGEEDGVKKHQ